MDIGSVDGEICRGTRFNRCADLVRELAAAKGPNRSTELIYCWDPDGPIDPRGFARPDHWTTSTRHGRMTTTAPPLAAVAVPQRSGRSRRQPAQPVITGSSEAAGGSSRARRGRAQRAAKQSA
jgi:hypothetical protein